MIRTSKHYLKHQNLKKTRLLEKLVEDFRLAVQFYVDAICCGQLPLKNNLSSKLLGRPHNLNARWSQLAYKQASSVVRSQRKRAEARRYKKYQKVYAYFSSKGTQTAFTSKKFSAFKLSLKEIQTSKYFTRPVIKNISIDLDERFWDSRSGVHFDEMICIVTPYGPVGVTGKRTRIVVPINHHRHSKKYFSSNGWTRKRTARLEKRGSKYFFSFIYEREATAKRSSGTILGLDQGYVKLITTSRGELLGLHLKVIYEKIANKQRGSRAYSRSLTERTNEIRAVVNSLDLTSVKTLKIEDLLNVKHGTRGKRSKSWNNKAQYWSYREVISQLQKRCEEEGIQLELVDPAYTSQTCHACKVICKTNRVGEKYSCSCGYTNDADVNAALNIRDK